MDGDAEKSEAEPEDDSPKAREVSRAYTVLTVILVLGATIAWVLILFWVFKRLLHLIIG